MPDAYLVEIHRFLARKKEAAETGLKEARTDDERAYFQGMLDEVACMKGVISDKYDLDYRDYGEAV